MNLETIITISIVIEVILLICFFSLCSNVANIKKAMATTQPFGALFNFYLSIGKKEKATELLIKTITTEECFSTAFFSNTDNKAKAQTVIQKKYEKYLEAVNLIIDFDKANVFLSAFNKQN